MRTLGSGGVLERFARQSLKNRHGTTGKTKGSRRCRTGENRGAQIYIYIAGATAIWDALARRFTDERAPDRSQETARRAARGRREISVALSRAAATRNGCARDRR